MLVLGRSPRCNGSRHQGFTMRTALWTAPIFLAFVASAAFGAGKLIKPDPMWTGSVEDLDLAKDAPTVITNQKAFAKLWESWKLGDKVPEIDFKKNLVILTTGRGSVLNLMAGLDDGDLKVNGFGTKDLRDGFRYAIGVVSRDGVKTVEGKKLPQE